MAEAEERQRVIEVARTYIGTPFHDQAGVKGVGIDCAHFLAACYFEAGVIKQPVDIEHYSPQFMLHRDDPLFESYVTDQGHEIPVEAVQPGDTVLYQIGRSYAHGAIVVEWPKAIIHAFKTFGFVAETGAFESTLRTRKVKFFSLWG